MMAVLATRTHEREGAADTFTIHLSNVTETIPVNNPCFGPMLGILNYDGVLHVTFHVTMSGSGATMVVQHFSCGG